MSNSVSHRFEGRFQFQGLFGHEICVKGLVNFDSVLPSATGTEVITVQGAKVGDMVHFCLKLDTGGAHIWAHVAADDTVHVHLHNTSGGSIDLAEAEFHMILLRPAMD